MSEDMITKTIAAIAVENLPVELPLEASIGFGGISN